MKKLKKQIRNLAGLAGGRPESLWGRFPERQELRLFDWPNRELGGHQGVKTRYSIRKIKELLATRSAARRSFFDLVTLRPTIIVFGAMHWERFGMWRSLADVARIEIF